MPRVLPVDVARAAKGPVLGKERLFPRFPPDAFFRTNGSAPMPEAPERPSIFGKTSRSAQVDDVLNDTSPFARVLCLDIDCTRRQLRRRAVRVRSTF